MKKEKISIFQDIAKCISLISPIPSNNIEQILSRLIKIKEGKEDNGTSILDECQILSNSTKDFDIICDAFNFLFKKSNKSFLHFLVTIIMKTNKKIPSEWLCNFIKNFPLSKEDFHNCFKEISYYLDDKNINITTLQNIISVIKAFYQINEKPNQHYFSFFPSNDITLDFKQIENKKISIGFFICISLDLTYFSKYKNNCTLIEAGNFNLQLSPDLKISFNKNSIALFNSNEIIHFYIDYQYLNNKIIIQVFDKNKNIQKQFNIPKQILPTSLRILKGFVGKVFSICGGFVSAPINVNKFEIIIKRINYNFELLNEVKNEIDKVIGSESNITNKLFFSFNAYNYYQNESDIFDDATRNYSISIGKGIFVHQNKNYTSNINLIGGINEILPVLNILSNNSNELKKCNDDLIKDIISIIIPLYKANKLDNINFIRVLGYFFENFPDNIFIDIKVLVNLICLNNISDVILKEIIFNHKIIFKYFDGKDKNDQFNIYIEFLNKNIKIVPQKLIVDLFDLFNNEMKTNNESCCNEHLKGKTIAISNVFLEKLKNLLKLINLNKEEGRDKIIKGLFSNLINGVSPCLKIEIYNILKQKPKNLIELNSKSLDTIFKHDYLIIEDFKFLLLLYNVFYDEYIKEKKSNYCIQMKFLEEIENKIKLDYLDNGDKDFFLNAAKYLFSSENDNYFETTLNFYFYLCRKTTKNLISKSFNEALKGLNTNNFVTNWKDNLNTILSNINNIITDNIDSKDVDINSYKSIIDNFNENKVNFIILLYYLTMTIENENYNYIFIEVIEIISENNSEKINKDNINLFFNDKYLYSKISNYLRKKIIESDVEHIEKYINAYNKFIKTFLKFSKEYKYLADIIYYEIALSLKQIKSLIDEKNIKEKQPIKREKIEEQLFTKIIEDLDLTYSTDAQIEQRRIEKIKKEDFRVDKFDDDDNKEEIVYIPSKNNINNDYFIEEIGYNIDLISLREVDFIEEYQKIVELKNKFKDFRRLSLYNKLVKRFFENNNSWQIKNDNDLGKKIKNYYTDDFKRPIITTINDLNDYQKKSGDVFNIDIYNYISYKNVPFHCFCEKVNRSIFGIIIIKNNEFYFQGFEKNNTYKEINIKLDDIDLFITCNDNNIKNNINDFNTDINLDKKKTNQIFSENLSRKVGLYLNNKKQYLFTFIDIKMKNNFMESIRDKIQNLIKIIFSNNIIGYSKSKYLEKIFKSEIKQPFDFSKNIKENIKYPISIISMNNLSNFKNPLNIYNYPKFIASNPKEKNNARKSIESNEKMKIKLFHPYEKKDFNVNGDLEIYYLPEIYEENPLPNIIKVNSLIMNEINKERKIIINEINGSSLDIGIKIPVNSIIYSAESLNDKQIVIVSDCVINIKIFITSLFSSFLNSMFINDYSIYNYYYAHFSQKYYTVHGKDGNEPPNYLSNNIVFSENKMYCFMGGLQDGNLIYFNLNDYCVPYIIETENFNKGKNVISALVLLENYMNVYYLICGDTCGNILLFSINDNFCIKDIKYPPLDNKIEVIKKKIDTNTILQGEKIISIHYKEITSMAINSTKDILVTSSEDFCIKLISFPDFRIIKSIKQSYINNYIYIFNYPFPCLLTFSNNQGSYHKGNLRLLSLNGKELKSKNNLNKFNHPRCIELYGKSMSKVIFQSDHQIIDIWNIDTFERFNSKSFNQTRIINYCICFDNQNNPNDLIINGYFGINITNNYTFQLEKLSKK